MGIPIEFRHQHVQSRLFSDITSFEIARDMPRDFVPFLEGIRWGTGGAVYRVKNYQNMLDAGPDRLHMSLRKRGKLVAARIAIPKSFSVNYRPIQAFYHGLFSVDPLEQGKGYGRLLAEQTLDYLRKQLAQKGILYSYIEEGNTRSATIAASFGYQIFGQFHSYVISRCFPRDSPRVFQPMRADEVTLRRLLEQQYSDHVLTDFDVSFNAGEYWALYDNGHPVAGVQVSPQEWQIESLPGLRRSFAFKAVFGFRPARDLLFSRSWRFLKIGNIYFQQHRANAFFELLDAMLYRFNTSIAVVFADDRSPAHQQLRRSGGFQLLDSFARTKVNVWGFFDGLSNTETSWLHKRPVAISPVDI